MADDLVAELDVVPVLHNVRQQIIRQAGSDLERAGADIGNKVGNSASKSLSTRLRHGVKEGFAGIGAGVIAGFGAERLFDSIIEESEQAIKVTKITAQLIESTGGAAHVTAGEVKELAKRMSEYAAIDDEVIQGAENVLLSFRNVHNEIGSGNDIFDRATKASLDLSTVLKTDLTGTVKQLGKALNDPVKGISALGRAGVQFTAGQKAQIKSLVENNRLLDAQKIILDQVEHKVGGAAGANATALDRLDVSVKNLEESLGTVLLPALDHVAEFTEQDLIPSLRTGGGIVQDFARTWGDLPEPIKAATVALVAFKLAQATGLTGSVATAAVSGQQRVASAIESGRLRAMLAREEFGRLTRGEIQLANGSGQFVAGVGRSSAALGALKVGAAGAGDAVKRGLSGALSIVGGPWGAAFIAGTAIVAHFWQQHQIAKQRIQDFSATLDKETGAVTKSSREFIANELLQSGALKAAGKLGVSLSLVTDAALGNKDAIAQLNGELERFSPTHLAAISASRRSAGAIGEQEAAANKLNGTVSSLNGTVRDSKTQHGLLAEAVKETATAETGVTSVTARYRTELDKTRSSIQKLLEKENERRSRLLGQFNDATALAQSLRDAREEAGKGAKTLDLNTEAGLKNRDALGQLAGQWNSSAGAVKNAKGAYEKFRADFITIATQMGATKEEAKHLADQLLQLPKSHSIDVRTPGMKQALEDARKLKEDLAAAKRSAFNLSLNTAKQNQLGHDLNRAGGGEIYGRGTKTSDSILVRASNGEFMQRAAAVDFYGLPFMRAINNLQLPKFAGGGQIGTATSAGTPGRGEIVGTLSWDRDGMLRLHGVMRQEISNGEANALAARRAGAIGGTPL